MSIDNYNKAKLIVEQNSNYSFFIGKTEKKIIQLAEKEIGFEFIGTYRNFLEDFGAGNFGGTEIYGITGNELKNPSVPNAIWYNLKQRKHFNFPNNLFAIYYTGSEEIFCLDYKNKNVDGEPLIVSYIIGVDMKDQPYELIAQDFGDFLLKQVTEELGYINKS